MNLYTTRWGLFDKDSWQGYRSYTSVARSTKMWGTTPAFGPRTVRWYNPAVRRRHKSLDLCARYIEHYHHNNEGEVSYTVVDRQGTACCASGQEPIMKLINQEELCKPCHAELREALMRSLEDWKFRR